MTIPSLLNFGMEITLYRWILESPQPIFFRKQKRVKDTILPKQSKLNNCLWAHYWVFMKNTNSDENDKKNLIFVQKSQKTTTSKNDL